VITGCIRCLEFGRNQFYLRVGRPQFRKAFFPEGLKVLRARISTLINWQLFEWEIESERHFFLIGVDYYPTKTKFLFCSSSGKLLSLSPNIASWTSFFLISSLPLV
jgi:hypothetical protein